MDAVKRAGVVPRARNARVGGATIAPPSDVVAYRELFFHTRDYLTTLAAATQG